MKFQVRIEVKLRDGVADPEGSTIERACAALGFDGVKSAKVNKVIELEVEASDEAAADQLAADLSARLLTNPVIEDSAIAVKALEPS